MSRSAKLEFRSKLSNGSSRLGAPYYQYRRPRTVICLLHSTPSAPIAWHFGTRCYGRRRSAPESGHLLTEDFRDGFVLQDAMFINPFIRENDRLIEKLLPQP
jgi:hypothetical protein